MRREPDPSPYASPPGYRRTTDRTAYEDSRSRWPARVPVMARYLGPAEPRYTLHVPLAHWRVLNTLTGFYRLAHGDAAAREALRVLDLLLSLYPIETLRLLDDAGDATMREVVREAMLP